MRMFTGVRVGRHAYIGTIVDRPLFGLAALVVSVLMIAGLLHESGVITILR